MKLEGQVVDVERESQRRIRRAAHGDVVDLVEELQRADGRDHRGEEDDRLQHRHGDVPEARPGRHAVDARRFVDRAVDVLHGREVEDHVVAGPAPGDGEDDHDLGPEGIAQPRDRIGDDSGKAQEVVDDAVIGEHRLEEDRVGDKRGDAGQEDRGAEEAAAPELAVVERDRKEQRQHEHDRHLHDEEDAGVAERAQEDGVLRQADDVGEAAEVEVHAAAGLEAHPKRPEDRVDHEDAEQHQSRRDEEPAVDLLAALEFCLCQAVPRRSPAQTIAYRHRGRVRRKGGGRNLPPGSHLLDLLLDLGVDGRRWRRRPSRPWRWAGACATIAASTSLVKMP